VAVIRRVAETNAKTEEVKWCQPLTLKEGQRETGSEKKKVRYANTILLLNLHGRRTKKREPILGLDLNQRRGRNSRGRGTERKPGRIRGRLLR